MTNYARLNKIGVIYSLKGTPISQFEREGSSDHEAAEELANGLPSEAGGVAASVARLGLAAAPLGLAAVREMRERPMLWSPPKSAALSSEKEDRPSERYVIKSP